MEEDIIKERLKNYAYCEDGLSKTKIGLKEVYNSSPTARSQAKHLCAGLEEFSEVELDFEGLDWMGQGFAHQLFIVFANNNPNVKLVIKGMSDDVKKMYNHVMNTK
ncbi:STAS-like domain-containing protein [uncultured Eubacterium sp.]|uniref:STAS-like domain-containing protein n=1 Tax=uncultured Eubacterium sp. TaxID=165185 RepID=UPI0025938D86|nr:STAS-like domain-containing protein [uncultured Eubacterium sp.]